MKTQLKTYLTTSFLVSAAVGSFSSFVNPVAAETLKGGVKEKAIDSSGSLRLKRNDTNQGVDPFGGGTNPDDSSAQLHPEAVDSHAKSAAVPDPFNMDQDGDRQSQTTNRPAPAPHAGRIAPSNNNRANSTTHNVSKTEPSNPGRSTAASANRSPAPNPLRAAIPAVDPEKSGEMLLQWDAWHARVAAAIYAKFSRLSGARFNRTVPLVCKVSYVVTRDGKIQHVRVLQPSSDPAFDDLVTTLIESFACRPVVRFPQESKRQSVERSGTFSLNVSKDAGYKYQKGDKEQIRD